MVTHERDVSRTADQVVVLADGRIADEDRDARMRSRA
jgi:hypothetical protein